MVEKTWNLRRYRALIRHWRREGPPTYVALAAYLGLRQPGRRRADALEGQDLINFLAAFPGGASDTQP
ncbi:MAG TPA: hypothetical protein VME40_12840 [Caulobacteraceae bacterium]|nr:hypothetical protein [Caulobacteraceae bacterium]